MSLPLFEKALIFRYIYICICIVRRIQRKHNGILVMNQPMRSLQIDVKGGYYELVYLYQSNSTNQWMHSLSQILVTKLRFQTISNPSQKLINWNTTRKNDDLVISLTNKHISPPWFFSVTNLGPDGWWLFVANQRWWGEVPFFRSKLSS